MSTSAPSAGDPGWGLAVNVSSWSGSSAVGAGAGVNVGSGVGVTTGVGAAGGGAVDASSPKLPLSSVVSVAESERSELELVPRGSVVDEV
jgi:hypothetical protein